MRVLVTGVVAALALLVGCTSTPLAPPSGSPLTTAQSPAPALPCPALDESAARAIAWSVEEHAVLRATCDRIAGLRQARATISVVDAQGRPVSAATIRIEQQRHGFPFGSHPNEVARGVLTAGEQATYDERFFALFNQVIWGMPWRTLEPVQGTTRLEGPERGLQYAARAGAVVRGHALIYVQENPAWFNALADPAERRRAAQRRVQDLMARYRSRVTSWVVVNEAKNTFALDRMRRGRELFEPLPSAVVQEIAAYADDAFRWARASDPSAVLIMNDNRMVSGRQLPSVEAVLAEMKRRDTPFDAVGIQSHMRNEGRVPLDTVQANLDRLAVYGRLHITELSVPARPLAAGETVFDAVAWDGWSEQTQAAYTVGLVTLAFGHPSVDAIAYWAMTDRRDDPPTNGAGLLRADLSPRPVYEALRALIREAWWTRWDGQTDRDGRAHVPMFYGEHHVVVSRPGGTPLATAVSVTRPDQVITLTLR